MKRLTLDCSSRKLKPALITANAYGQRAIYHARLSTYGRNIYHSAVSVTTRIIEKRPRLRLFARQFIRSSENKTDYHISSLHLIRCIKKNIRQAISHNLKNGLRFFDISFSRILMLTDSTTFAVSCIWRHNEPDEGWCSIMPNASIVAWHLPP